VSTSIFILKKLFPHQIKIMACLPEDFLCVVNNCSGAIGVGNILFNYWDQNNCPAAYSQMINTTSTSPFLEYNPTAQQALQSQISRLFDTYNETNKITDDVTSSDYNPFQETLLALCLNPALPGICDQHLISFCSPYVRTQVSASPTLTNFCGCYVAPDPDYLKYTLGSPGCLIGTGCTAGCKAGDPGCVGQPSCDPLCHRALTVQKAYQPTGNFITCPQTICVIDDVTIQVNESSINRGINFNTVCAGCGGPGGVSETSSCLCVVSGVNISAVASQVGLGVNFNQFCGSNSVCLIEDNSGNIISEGGCTGINPLNIPIPDTYYPPNPGIVFIVILFFFIVLFGCLAANLD